MQTLPGFTGQPPALFEHPRAYAATPSELAHAQVGKVPVGRAALQQGGAEQTVIETTGYQAVIGQPGFDQCRGIRIGRQKPGWGIGEDFRQIDAVLLGGLGYGFNEYGHVDLAVVLDDGSITVVAHRRTTALPVGGPWRRWAVSGLQLFGQQAGGLQQPSSRTRIDEGGFGPIMRLIFRPRSAELLMSERTACVERNTLETQVKATINLDGTGKSRFAIGVPFLEHMLDQIARHGLIDLDIECQGDLHIDDHHTVEDVGITLGQAFSKAVGDKKGMTRYGHSYVPLDEALSRVVIDFSGRPGLQMHVPYTRATVGGFDVDLFQEFFQGFVNHALVTLHIDNLRGHNTHHQIETVFKAFGRALRMAVTLDERMAGQMPSTKGCL